MSRNEACSSYDSPKRPFITIVTRCYKRPEALRNNVRSLKAQTDLDYEQVFIIDRIGHGLAAADQSLNKYKDANCGEYVMVLDDDDMITDNQFIEKLKAIKKAENPDIIIWKGKFFQEQTILPPEDSLWGIRPIRFKIGSFSYCMTHKLFSKYIHVCKTGDTGDFDFIHRVFYSDEKPKISWTKDVFVRTQNTPSHGRIEDNGVTTEFRISSTGKQRRVIRHR